MPRAFVETSGQQGYHLALADVLFAMQAHQALAVHDRGVVNNDRRVIARGLRFGVALRNHRDDGADR
jgi:hypothetical protein